MANTIPLICRSFEHRLIVSCQAPEGNPFSDSDSMARFALAAVSGGTAGIRANSPADVSAIGRVVRVPIIGIQKERQDDGQILITGSFEMARRLVEAGADLVALDCTARGQRYGAMERLRRIRHELGVPVMADIATLEEARTAAEAGADLVGTTMRGYTQETIDCRTFEPAFVSALVRVLKIPVIAEGRIGSPAQAAQAIDAGAFAVVIGTAITRPDQITGSFAQAIERRAKAAIPRYFIGIDLGGTNTKYGVASNDGEMVRSGVLATPSGGGREILLRHLEHTARVCRGLAEDFGVAPAALGIATAGYVDPGTGCVLYATDNLPGWTGTHLADALHKVTALPVAVDNDAVAFAVAERHFGAAKGVDDFMCMTLGTGVGGGGYVGGRLHRGAHFLSNAVGHLIVEPNGYPCTCGRKGCLEAHANAAAMLRYAEGSFANPAELIQAAALGNSIARKAIRTYAGYLAAGMALAVHLLDPRMLVLAGGLTEKNSCLLSDLEEELSARVMAWDRREVQIRISPLGYFGGVLGAVALASEKLETDFSSAFQGRNDR
jgi:N-acetylmannosamine-6-phosphate 2-epimerase/N-acetylmannosamine kinase